MVFSCSGKLFKLLGREVEPIETLHAGEIRLGSM